MHASAAGMVGNLETIICGKLPRILSLIGKNEIKQQDILPKQNRDAYKFTYLRKVMLSLLESRRELLGATLTQDQTLELQLKVISKIDWGNRYVLTCCLDKNSKSFFKLNI